MPPQTESLVAGLELERVRDRLSVLFDRDGVFFADIEKRDVEVISNRQMRIPLEVRPGGKGGAYDPDGGDLGRGSGSTFDKAVISAVAFKQAVEWTALADFATDNSRKAIIQNTRYQLAQGMKEFRRLIDSLCMTDGTGTLANATTTAIGTGTNGGDIYTCTGDGYGVRLLRFDQNFNVYNAALSTNRTAGAERTVNFLDLENKIFHGFPSLATLANTDKVVLSGLTATPPVHLFGVPYHHSNASSGTWLGFNRATTPEIRANRVNAGGALALPFPRLALNKIGNRVGITNMEAVVAYMHPCQKQAYEELGMLVSVINKTAKDDGLDLYFGDNMQMAGAPVKVSFSWDKTRIDFINKNLWGRAELRPIDYYTAGDGRKVFEIRGPSGGVAASMIFYLVTHFNLFVNNPAACAYIDGLTVPSGY